MAEEVWYMFCLFLDIGSPYSRDWERMAGWYYIVIVCMIDIKFSHRSIITLNFLMA
jgi:hypothetical protein